MKVPSGTPPFIPFGYSNILKTEFKAGNLPTVVVDFFGDPIDKANVSLDHALPKSKGGASKLFNYLLVTQENNNKRGNGDLKDFVIIEKAKAYFLQFIGVKTKKFNGDKYAKDAIENLKRMGIDLYA